MSGTFSTLSDRLEAVYKSMESILAKRVLAPEKMRIERNCRFPDTAQRYCMVCGVVRFDPDPTGMTCGASRCIDEVIRGLESDEFLWDIFLGFVSNVRLTANILGDRQTVVEAVFAEIEKYYGIWDKIGQQVREEIAPALGVDVKKGDKERDLDDILEELATEAVDLRSRVDSFEAQIRKMAKALGIKTEDKSMKTICDEAIGEVESLTVITEQVEKKVEQQS